jgi:hypothetical protein
MENLDCPDLIAEYEDKKKKKDAEKKRKSANGTDDGAAKKKKKVADAKSNVRKSLNHHFQAVLTKIYTF